MFLFALLVRNALWSYNNALKMGIVCRSCPLFYWRATPTYAWACKDGLSVIIEFFFRFACALCYFAISFEVDDLAGNIFINNFLMCMVEGLSYVFCFGIAWWGRKWPTVSVFLGGGFALLASVLVSLYVKGQGEILSLSDVCYTYIMSLGLYRLSFCLSASLL